jgi:hypothetical protein
MAITYGSNKRDDRVFLIPAVTILAVDKTAHYPPRRARRNYPVHAWNGQSQDRSPIRGAILCLGPPRTGSRDSLQPPSYQSNAKPRHRIAATEICSPYSASTKLSGEILAEKQGKHTPRKTWQTDSLDWCHLLISRLIRNKRPRKLEVWTSVFWGSSFHAF